MIYSLVFYLHYIEPARHVPAFFFKQIFLRDESVLFALFCSHRLRRRAEIVRRSGFHFDENRNPVLSDDQIYLADVSLKVFGENFVPRVL